MKHDIIIHAGTHKTGSTSIQKWFIKNSAPEITYLDWFENLAVSHYTASAVSYVNSLDVILKKAMKLKTEQDALNTATKLERTWSRP